MKHEPDVVQVTQPPKKSNFLFRLLAFLLTLALFLGAVALVVYRDRLNFDALRRSVRYRTLEKNDSGQAVSFPHGGTLNDSFASVNDGLLACSTAGIRLYSRSGTPYVEKSVALQHPVTQVAGEFSLVYDVGGRELFLFRSKEEAFSLALEEGHQLLSARVNTSGYLAITTQESGYKGSVTVYSPAHKPVLQLNLSSSFLMDAVVTDDGKWLAAVTIGQGETAFESRLCLYKLERTPEETTPEASCSLGNNVVLELREAGGSLWALGENSVSAVSPAGELQGTYAYSDRYLKEFTLGGNNFAVLLLGKYRAGSLAELTVVDSAGSTRTLPIHEQVLALSAAGRYIGVLTADRLDIYTQDLELYATLQGTQGARQVLMRTDGTAMLISTETARLYVPT